MKRTIALLICLLCAGIQPATAASCDIEIALPREATIEACSDIIDNVMHRLEERGRAAIVRGGVYLLMGETDQAIRDYRMVGNDLDPMNVYAWIGLGNAYRAAKKTDEAVAAYARAIELNSWSPEPYLASAELAEERGDLHRAFTLWRHLARQLDHSGHDYRAGCERLRAILTAAELC